MRQNWFSIMTRIRLGTIYNQRIESLLSLPKELGLINHLWSERRAESILSDVQPKSIDQSIDGWEQITVYTITPLMTSVAIMFGSFVFTSFLIEKANHWTVRRAARKISPSV